jgi:glutamate synthase (NADPH/NADH) large chain
MAAIGLRSLNEMTGRADLLEARTAIDHWKAKGADLSKLLHVPESPGPRRFIGGLQRSTDAHVDREIIAVLDGVLPARVDFAVTNVDRSIGARASGEVARRHGHAGLPDGSVHALITGTAGQSFGAFLVHGLTLELVGDANDYVGKGLCGGRLIVRQPPHVTRDPAANIIVGNTCLYGATSGEAFLAGVAGERFAVRNSGAIAVIEGLGDHGCEYMTGGIIVVLGPVGRNFAAGMSGGIAYIWDPEMRLANQCNGVGVALEAVEDEALLRSLVERHAEFTGSARASAMLKTWPECARSFVQVMPHEYRRALADLAVAAE